MRKVRYGLWKAAAMCLGLMLMFGACGQKDEETAPGAGQPTMAGEAKPGNDGDDAASGSNGKEDANGGDEKENPGEGNGDEATSGNDGKDATSGSDGEDDASKGNGTEDKNGDNGEEKDWYQQMLEASILSKGSNGRLEKVLQRMAKGEKVTVAFVGGSVTEGALAATYEESYADCFMAGLQEAYPDAELAYINAGLSGTGSSLGVMRYERDVVEAGGQPDIVFLEFAINDYQEPTGGRAYESMIRTILGADNDPAVVLLFSVSRSEWNMQDNYIPMGEHYGLPMASIRSAVKKPLADGDLTKETFFADEYHPTTYGHSIMADCLEELVRQVGVGGGIVKAVPRESVKSADFMDMRLLTSQDAQDAAVAVGGFSEKDSQVHGFGRKGGASAFPDNWMHTAESGSEAFRVELNCRNIILNYKTSASGDFGKACVYVDGSLAAELDGHVDGAWNNSIQALVLDEQENGDHVLEIRMAEGDEEKCFTLLAIGCSRKEPSGLAKRYEDNFPIGVALPGSVVRNAASYKDVILDNYNSITCENEMKPDALLDRAASRANLEETYLRAAVHFDSCMPAIEFALENNLKIRFHTLVWHSQTPKWFFTEDYTDNGELVSREVMLARMENYIADVLGFFQENYPGLIYAVDVANEAFDVGNGDADGVRQKDNLWYDTVGADYYYQAFVFARKYASADMKLFYNDYGCMNKADLILKRLAQAKEEGLIDGIGMQSHLSTSDRIQSKLIITVTQFCEAGYEVQATELDIGMPEDTDSYRKTQARKYRIFFENMKKLQEKGYAVTGITLWGLNDELSWRSDEHALLYDGNMEPKEAYLGAMLDPSVLSFE